LIREAVELPDPEKVFRGGETVKHIPRHEGVLPEIPCFRARCKPEAPREAADRLGIVIRELLEKTDV
jgi:hypothetical protein